MNPKIKMRKTNTFSTSIIVIAVLFSSLVSLTIELNSIALYVAIPVAFLISLILRGRILINGYYKIYIYLCLWLLFTTIFAFNTESALREMRQVLGAFLLSYIVSFGATDSKMRPWMYVAFITLYLSALFYAYTHILYVGWDIGGQDRLNDDVLNANKLAYYTFYATIAFYMLAELITKKKIINKSFRVLFLSMIPLSFGIALMTASRQVLIIQVPTILMLGYIRYFKNKSSKRTILTLFVVIGVALFAASRVSDIYNDSYLAERNEKSLAEDSRPKLMANAIQVGFDNPVVGVGPGCFYLVSYNHHYSHCTYTELFANTGFIGFLLYFILVFRLLILNFRRYRRSKDLHYLVYASFALMFIIYNFFYVFYKDIWLTAFFFLVASDSESYYNNQKYLKRNADPR